MTEEEQRHQIAAANVIIAAVMIAASVPTKHGKYTTSANVSWRLIEELQSALDVAVPSWKAVRQ